jgi:hypothetical protein
MYCFCVLWFATGLVCERQNRLTDAVTSFTNAEQSLSTSSSGSHSVLFRAIRINHARVLVSIDRAQDSIVIWEGLMKDTSEGVTPTDVVSLRLWYGEALIAADQYPRADTILKEALTMTAIEPGATGDTVTIMRSLRRQIQLAQAQLLVKQKVPRKAIELLQNR